MTVTKWNLLTSAANMMEAEIIKGALEGAGFQVNLKWESFSSILFGNSAIGPHSQVQVLVPEECLKDAQDYLESIKST